MRRLAQDFAFSFSVRSRTSEVEADLPVFDVLCLVFDSSVLSLLVLLYVLEPRTRLGRTNGRVADDLVLLSSFLVSRIVYRDNTE